MHLYQPFQKTAERDIPPLKPQFMDCSVMDATLEAKESAFINALCRIVRIPWMPNNMARRSLGSMSADV